MGSLETSIKVFVSATMELSEFCRRQFLTFLRGDVHAA
jgi:hypothetical protein